MEVIKTKSINIREDGQIELIAIVKYDDGYIDYNFARAIQPGDNQAVETYIGNTTFKQLIYNYWTPEIISAWQQKVNAQ